MNTGGATDDGRLAALRSRWPGPAPGLTEASRRNAVHTVRKLTGAKRARRCAGGGIGICSYRCRRDAFGTRRWRQVARNAVSW